MMLSSVFWALYGDLFYLWWGCKKTVENPTGFRVVILNYFGYDCVWVIRILGDNIRRWGLPYSIQSHELFFLHELFPYYLFIPLVFVTIDKAVGKVILDNCGDLRVPIIFYYFIICGLILRTYPPTKWCSRRIITPAHKAHTSFLKPSQLPGEYTAQLLPLQRI